MNNNYELFLITDLRLLFHVSHGVPLQIFFPDFSLITLSTFVTYFPKVGMNHMII